MKQNKIKQLFQWAQFVYPKDPFCASARGSSSRHPLPSRNSEMALNGFELLSVPRYQTNQPTSHSEASNFLMIEFVDLY